MTGQRISAEITAVNEHNDEVARALQTQGFRILHIGPTLSVEGDMSLWESTFGVRFEPRTKGASGAIKVSYEKALTDDLRIPAALEHLILDVAFAEPPDFF